LGVRRRGGVELGGLRGMGFLLQQRVSAKER